MYQYPLNDNGEPIYPCAGDTITLGNNNCQDAVRVTWAQVNGPVATQFNFDDASIQVTTGNAPIDGRYTLKRCCYFDVNGPDLPPEPSPGMICPSGAMVGDKVQLNLFGCSGIADWQIVAGTGTLTAQDNTTAFLSSDIDGPVRVSVTCASPGSPSSFTYSCEVIFYPLDQQFTTTISEFVELTGAQCGEYCSCEEVDIIFQCDDDESFTVKTPIYFEPKYSPRPKPEPQTVTAVPLTGSPQPLHVPKNVISKACEPDISCDPHVPAIFWNDVSNCGWTYTASNEANGTSVYGAVGNSLGMKWCFQGTTTLTLSGPAAFVDTLILYGHNMSDATITTSPLVPFGGGPTGVGAVTDKSCLEGYTNPVNIQFNDVQDSITSLTVTIEPGDPSKVICISNIFLGRKFILESGLPETWTNPFFGTDREVITRQGVCGPTSVSSKRKMLGLSIPIECVSEAEMKECYMPLLRYLSCPNPLYFAWSINQCPADLFYGWIRPVAGATYQDAFSPTLNIEASGFIRQMQPKQFV